MNTAVARKRTSIPMPTSIGPAVTVEVSTPSEIQQVLMDREALPGPGASRRLRQLDDALHHGQRRHAARSVDDEPRSENRARPRHRAAGHLADGARADLERRRSRARRRLRPCQPHGRWRRVGGRARSVDGRRRRAIRLARHSAQGSEPQRQEVRRQREDEEPARVDAVELRPARRHLRGDAARQASARVLRANGEGVVQRLRQARRETARRDGGREALSASVSRPHLSRAAPACGGRGPRPEVRVASQGLGRVLGAAGGRPLARRWRCRSAKFAIR